MNEYIYGAIEDNNCEKLEKLANEGVDINAPDEGGWTPAHFAAYRGRLNSL